MELCLYLSNLEHWENLDEVLRYVDYAEQAEFATKCLFHDPNSYEYFGHLVSLKSIQSMMLEADVGFSRLYFGQEFCEHLVPPEAEVRQAFFESSQSEINFTYVTGPATFRARDRIKRNIDALAADSESTVTGLKTEVVVNDWGILRYLAAEHPQFHAVLGRFLLKQKRMGRFANGVPQPYMGEIETPAEVLIANQKEAWRHCNLTSEVYRAELHRLGGARVDIDIVPQGISIAPQDWGFDFGCYYPWTYLTGSRNCPTAGLVDPKRAYVAVDEACPKPCRTCNASVVSVNDPQAFNVQRGTGVFVFNHSYAHPYMSREIPVSRVIYQPYIPL